MYIPVTPPALVSNDKSTSHPKRTKTVRYIRANTQQFPTFRCGSLPCTRGSTSARSAVLLLQQIREQLGVTQLRDVAHSLRRGEGGCVRVRQTAHLSRRNAAHACKRCSSRRSLSVQTTTSGERGAVVGSESTCSRAHVVKICPPLSPRAGPHASRPWRRPPRAKSHSRAQRRGTAETRRPAAPRPSR